MNENKGDLPENGHGGKGFKLDLNPRIEVPTSIGPVFLYENRDALREYVKQAEDDVPRKVRRYMARIASVTQRKNWKEPHIPLTQEQELGLSDDDVERMATAYLNTKNCLYFISEGRKVQPPVARDDNETAISFLNRLLLFWAKHEGKRSQELFDSFSGLGNISRTLEQFNRETQALDELKKRVSGISDPVREASKAINLSDQTRKLVEGTYGRSTSALEQLRKSAFGLSHMVQEELRRQKQFDELRKSAKDTQQDLDVSKSTTFEPVRHMIDAQREQRRERREELELARSTRDLTVRSAEHLAQLSQTTTTMLGQFGEFLKKFADDNQRADEHARRQLTWALRSLIVTVVLTLISTSVAFFSYQQDAGNNRANDGWQREISGVLHKQTSLTEQSIQSQSAEIMQLRQRIESLEKSGTPRAGPPASRDQSSTITRSPAGARPLPHPRPPDPLGQPLSLPP